MWEAIRNLSVLVKPGGLLYLAVYNRVDSWGIHPDGRFGPSSFWEKEKRFYCRLPAFLRWLVNTVVMVALVLSYLIRLRNPLSIIRGHGKFRGMSWSIDIIDWLGGYPYEYASVDEVFGFCHHKLGLQLENLKTPGGLRNNEFLFRKLAGG
jgi:2-polyprenyl-6-hydroxyphenyl methylase/3-demethylubiquinone-9 3-methyltransferase